MFITKKKLNEKIMEALEKERERQWQMNRIDDIERTMFREFNEFDKRIRDLEKLANVNQVVCSDEKTCEAVMPAIR